MKNTRTIGWVALVGLASTPALGGCDLVAGIGEYCEVGVDPGCGTGGTAGSGGGGTGGTTSPTGGGGSGGAATCSPGGAMQACYGGPDGSKDIGVCKGGMQTCQADGTWGPCDGEVVPASETCASTDDEDCDGKECALWSKIFGDSANQAILDVKVNPAGDLLVFGFFTGEMTGLMPPLVSAGSNDLFLMKMSPAGEVLWARSWGDVGDQSAGAMAIDAGGNIVLAGSFQGGIDFGPGNVLLTVGSDDIYVAKLDGDGNTIWAKQYGDDKSQIGRDVAVTPLGDICVVGAFAGVTNFGDTDVMSSGLNDAFIVKLAGNGSLLWKRIVGDAMVQTAAAIAVDSLGDAVVTGFYQGSVTFGDTMLSNPGDIFVTKLGTDGAFLWAKSLSVLDAQPQPSGDGGVWLSGSVAVPVNFGGGQLTPAGLYDVYLAKLDSNGSYVNAKLFGGGGAEGTTDISVDEAGSVLIAVQGDGGIDFGDGPLLSSGENDVFVARFDDAFGLEWARKFGDSMAQSFGKLAGGAGGHAYLGCKVSGTINFGAGDLSSMGNDVAIARLAP